MKETLLETIRLLLLAALFFMSVYRGAEMALKDFTEVFEKSHAVIVVQRTDGEYVKHQLLKESLKNAE